MIYAGNRDLVPHPRPSRIRYEGLSAPLTPSVQVFSDPIATPGPTQPPRPAVGQMPSYQCPPPFVPYAAYIDPAGNYEYPGCMMPSSGAPVSSPQTATPSIPTASPTASPAPLSPSVSSAPSITGGGSGSFSTSITTNTSPLPTPPPNDLMLEVAIAVLLFVVFS